MKTATIRPINNQVLCRHIDPPTKIGSLFLPEKSRERTNKVEIIAVGPHVKDQENIKPGLTAHVGHFAGHDVEVDNEKYVLVTEADVYAIYL